MTIRPLQPPPRHEVETENETEAATEGSVAGERDPGQRDPGQRDPGPRDPGPRDPGGEGRDQAGQERHEAGQERDEAGQERDEAGDRRDQAAERRDQAGDRRDQAAGRRDQAAGRRDQAAEQSETRGTDEIAADALYRATMARREAASDRRRASQDRQAGASERDHAELDRDTALADRGASAREREFACHDDLTGAYLRGPGVVELAREMVRAIRTAQPLVVAFVDVDYLKAINDSRGHAAGDRVLVEVAAAFRVNLRPYDLIIRYGGDEFVCAMASQTMSDATARLQLVKASLAAAPELGTITVGLAELQPGDSVETLVARADAALYRQRQQERSPFPADGPADGPADVDDRTANGAAKASPAPGAAALRADWGSGRKT